MNNDNFDKQFNKMQKTVGRTMLISAIISGTISLTMLALIGTAIYLLIKNFG